MSTKTIQAYTKRVGLALFGAGFLLMCFALPDYFKVRSSAAWPHTQGVITTSHLEVGYLKQLKGYYGVVEYDYSVAGGRFHGTHVSFNKVHLGLEDAWQRAVDKYPVGKKVAVYYDPKEPAVAVLEPGLFGEMHVLYVMCVVLLTFFGGAFLLVLFRRSSSCSTCTVTGQEPD